MRGTSIRLVAEVVPQRGDENDAEKDILKSAQGGGFTPTTASAENLRREAVYAHDWYNNMTREIYG